jgi:hypothetical protein
MRGDALEVRRVEHDPHQTPAKCTHYRYCDNPAARREEVSEVLERKTSDLRNRALLLQPAPVG